MHKFDRMREDRGFAGRTDFTHPTGSRLLLSPLPLLQPAAPSRMDVRVDENAVACCSFARAG